MIACLPTFPAPRQQVLSNFSDVFGICIPRLAAPSSLACIPSNSDGRHALPSLMLVFLFICACLIVAWFRKDPRNNLELLREIATDAERRQTLMNDSTVAMVKTWGALQESVQNAWADPERRRDLFQAIRTVARSAVRDFATWLRAVSRGRQGAYESAEAAEDEGDDVSLSVGTRSSLKPVPDSGDGADSAETDGDTVLLDIDDRDDAQHVGGQAPDAGAPPGEVTMRL